MLDIEGILICDGSPSIDMAKVSMDQVEAAIHQDDSCSGPNAEQRDIWWHSERRRNFAVN